VLGNRRQLHVTPLFACAAPHERGEQRRVELN
jgi:hypothetical protein